MPVHATFLTAIDVNSANYADRTAVQFADETITYRELNRKANQLANLLSFNGVKPGSVVALATGRSINMVISLLAILKAGAAYLPLDPAFPAERLNFMLADSKAKLLLTSREYHARFENAANVLYEEDAFIDLNNYPDTHPDVSLTGDGIAYLLYTSGSTGKPKGVQISHHNFTNLLISIQRQPGVTADDTWLAIATISFDIASLELFLPLMVGAKLIIADSETVKDGQLLLDIVRKQKVTILQATPYTWRMLLASDWSEKLPLKAFCGGEAMPRDLADKLLPRCNELWNLYGPTETTIYSIGKQIKATDTVITIGKPIANTQVYIMDDTFNEVPAGNEGEICIGGDGVSPKGYLNRPELTAEKFISDPFSKTPGAKLYRTGDLGKLMPDGEINYLGRMDNQVKIRGYRIEAGEIEYNLLQQKGIKNAVVLVHEDGLGNPHLVAYLATANHQLNATERAVITKSWSETLKSRLPEYMVPDDYVLLPELPRTPSGKIDRKLLPKPEFFVSATAYAAPETETEGMITEIWGKYLGKERSGIDDNFFELGGHSLIAVQIMTMIGKVTGKLLPIAILFKYPTVRKLAALLLSDEVNNSWRSLVPIKPSGSKMPVYIIHGEGLNVLIFNNVATYVDPDQPVYGLQSRGLNGTDDVPESIEAMAALYLQEILEQNSNGPYALAGYSFGGYVAIEMAQQLQRMGKEVKLLAMLDANFKPPEDDLTLPMLVRDKSVRQVRKLFFTAGSLVKQPGMALAYQRHMIKTRLKPLGFFKEHNPEHAPEYMQPIVDKLREVVRHYKMKPFNGVIHVFRSKVRMYYLDDPKYLGWGQYALKGVMVHEVQGDHRDMLLPPNDKDFARLLQQCLDNSCT